MFYHTHKLSSQLSESDIFHILNIFSVAFSQSFDIELFKRKYIDNPFGDSLHILSYNNCHDLVATRVLWKLDSALFYQCVDTAVHPFYQGKGLFKQSTSYITTTFPDLSFYNKPNSRSLPQYLKYGWNVEKVQKIGISSRFNKKFLHSIPLTTWSKSQLTWRMSLTNDNNYTYFLRDGLYYISAKKRNFCDMVLFKTPIYFSIPKSRSLLFFSFDSCSTFKLPYTQTLLSRSSNHYAPPSFYFDMT